MSRRELADFDAVTHTYFQLYLVLRAFRAPKQCSFEVDDPPEARTWAIVFLNDFNSILMAMTLGAPNKMRL